jgi:DNA polymerase
MFKASAIDWWDFETFSALELKPSGPFRYATDPSTRAIVLAYAIGDGPVQIWEADGAILDWRTAPDDLRESFARDRVGAAWNAPFDSAIWNYATLDFPFLEVEHIIDPMVQAVVSNLPADLESASRYLGGEGKQKDGKKLIKMFCVEGADPKNYPGEWQRFLAYARQDIEAMREVYRKTRPLSLEEWQQYWAFEHINRRGVMLDMPFVGPAERLAAEDSKTIGQRLSVLTAGAITSVNQAQRIALWLYNQLPDEAMREVLLAGDAEDEDEIEDDDINGNGNGNENGNGNNG